jgi:hypothetical protein
MESHIITSLIPDDASLKEKGHVPTPDLVNQEVLSAANESIFEFNGWHKMIGEVPESLPPDVSVGTILTVTWPKPFTNGKVFFYRQGRVTPLPKRWREYRVYTRTERGWQRDHTELA